MKKLTIYDVHVEMQDQAQCDRMKNLCIDNELNILRIFFTFWNEINKNNIFGFDINTRKFAVHELCKRKTNKYE